MTTLSWWEAMSLYKRRRRLCCLALSKYRLTLLQKADSLTLVLVQAVVVQHAREYRPHDPDLCAPQERIHTTPAPQHNVGIRYFLLSILVQSLRPAVIGKAKPYGIDTILYLKDHHTTYYSCSAKIEFNSRQATTPECWQFLLKKIEITTTV